MKEELTEEQRIAARLIAVKTPFSKVAIEVGISLSTLRRWRKEPRFMQRVAELTHPTEPLNEGEGSESDNDLLPLAIHSLRELLGSKSASAKLGAARLIVQLHRLTQANKNKGVTMNEAVFEAAAQMLVELFRRRDDLRKEALVELEKIHLAEEVSVESDN